MDKKIIYIGIAVVVLAFGGLFLLRGEEGPHPSQAVYRNEMYKVSFYYPKEWQPVEGDDTYEGESGFFTVSAAGGELTIEDVVQSEAGHVLKPYGSEPRIERVKVGGQEGVMILPSEDADPSMRGQAALILPYPSPVTISGNTYEHFVLWADEFHIKGMADSLEFLI